MKLEGVAEIELTNVHTGEKERYVEKNMVTNALSEILTKNLYGRVCANLSGTVLPLYRYGLGGIFAFDGNIEEDPNNVVAPGNVECVAHAGDTSYNGANLKRGSKNTTETTILDDGIKIVWDFATNQGNGTIKCLSLTSARGGNMGYGTDLLVNDSFEAPTLFTTYAENSAQSFCDKDFVYSIVIQSSSYYIKDGVMKITRSSLPSGTVRILSDFQTQGKIEEFTISIQEMTTSTSSSFISYHGKNYIYAIESNKTRFCLYEIGKDFNSLTKIMDMSVSGLYQYARPAIMNDYIYMRSNGNIMMKINMYNPTDITSIKLPYACHGISNSSQNAINRVGNRIYCNKNIIDANDKVFYNTASESLGNYYHFFNTQSELIIIFNDMNTRLNFMLNPLYLATINNLATPVIKTADKTMKITYTIREKVE